MNKTNKPRLQPGPYCGWEVLGDDPKTGAYKTRCPKCKKTMVKKEEDMRRGYSCADCYRKSYRKGGTRRIGSVLL